MRRSIAHAFVGVMALTAVQAASAHTVFEASLDTAQAGGSGSGTGTGTFTLEDDSTLTYSVDVQGLAGNVVGAHIHKGAPGVAGGIEVTLDTTTVTGNEGTFSGTTAPLTTAQVELLGDGMLYANIHTTANFLGEIRGQVLVKPGCPCSGTRGTFLRCVKDAIKALEKDDRKDEAVKRIKKFAKKSSCGRSKGPKKAVACCLPRTLDANIVTEALCAPVPEKACTAIGGENKGASCFGDADPCSPSGAFVDALD